jgi:ubiquinone biosynthesis protein Coq4
MAERFADRPFIIRYTQSHDLHHVILGFDTGLAGEIGVGAFMLGQVREAYRPIYVHALQHAWLFSPSQRAQVRKNFEIGLRLGRQAPLLVAEPLEDWFAEPLEKVRARLGLTETARKDIAKSGRSAYLELMMELGGAQPGKRAA